MSSGSGMVSNSWRVIIFCKGLKCSVRLPIMEPSLGFTNVKNITIPTTSFVNGFGSLRSWRLRRSLYGKKDLIRQVFWSFLFCSHVSLIYNYFRLRIWFWKLTILHLIHLKFQLFSIRHLTCRFNISLICITRFSPSLRAATEMDKRPVKIFLVNYPPALCTSEG